MCQEFIQMGQEKAGMSSPEKLKNLLNLAIKANKLVYGREQVLRQIKQNKVYLVIIAQDLSISSAKSLAKYINHPFLEIVQWETKSFYQQIFGKEVGIIGITDINFKIGLKKIYSFQASEA